MLEVQVADQFISNPEEQPYYDLSFARSVPSLYVLASRKTVRVITGKLGPLVRISAPEFDIIAEGLNQKEAWETFLNKIRNRDDCAWLAFDVGPTRCEEIEEGLNAPEDEDWSEPITGTEE
jgi:hypothetical protein